MADLSWETKSTRNPPSPRYAHAAIHTNNQLFMYGGITDEGISDELYVLNTRDWNWRKIETSDPFPLYPVFNFYYTISNH